MKKTRLVLGRDWGQRICIGDDITIEVRKSPFHPNDGCRVAIVAPETMGIWREEVALDRQRRGAPTAVREPPPEAKESAV